MIQNERETISKYLIDQVVVVAHGIVDVGTSLAVGAPKQMSIGFISQRSEILNALTVILERVVVESSDDASVKKTAAGLRGSVKALVESTLGLVDIRTKDGGQKDEIARVIARSHDEIIQAAESLHMGLGLSGGFNPRLSKTYAIIQQILTKLPIMLAALGPS